MDAPRVRVWVGDDRALQHTTTTPGDDTVRAWDGATDCGLAGPLQWIPPEVVDRASTCAACATVTGTTPPLSGQDIPTP